MSIVDISPPVGISSGWGGAPLPWQAAHAEFGYVMLSLAPEAAPENPQEGP